MSYRLINANALNGVISNDDYEKVLNAPCIFADLPNGLDGEHYNLQEPKIKVLNRNEAMTKLGEVDVYKASAWITLLNDLEYLGLKICEVEE